MNLLLDTHVFLWFISGDSRLPAEWRDALCDPSNLVYVSVASLWEVTIKFQIGKLPLPAPPGVYLPAQRERHSFTSLPLDERSVGRLESLPNFTKIPSTGFLSARLSSTI